MLLCFTWNIIQAKSLFGATPNRRQSTLVPLVSVGLRIELARYVARRG